MRRDAQTILADLPGFGRVYDCGDCGSIHFQIGAVAITLPPEAYMKLVAMVNASAASMEAWIQSRSPGSGLDGRDAS